MTTKDAATPDVPPAAVVVYGTDEATPPNAKDAKAAAEREATDRARGYREVTWKPGVTIYQSLATAHTTLSEADMQRYERERAMETATALPLRG